MQCSGFCVLPSHLHNVMEMASPPLACGRSEAALKLCNKVVQKILRQGWQMYWSQKVTCSKAPHIVEPFLMHDNGA